MNYNPHTRQNEVPPTEPDYTHKVDAVLRAATIYGFTAEDFLDLAMAAIDQAGVSLGDQQRIARILGLPDPEES